MLSGCSFFIIKVFHYLSIAKLSQSQRRHSYQSLHWGRSLHWQSPAEETQLPKSTLGTQHTSEGSWGRSLHWQGPSEETQLPKSTLGKQHTLARFWRCILHWQGPAEKTQLPKFTLRMQPSLARSSWGDTVTKVYVGDTAHISRVLGTQPTFARSSWGPTVTKVYTGDAAFIGKVQLRRHSYQSLHWGRSPHWQGPAEETQLPKSTLRMQPTLARSSWGDTVTKVYINDHTSKEDKVQSQHWGLSPNWHSPARDTVRSLT